MGTPRRRAGQAGIFAGVRLLASVKNRWLRKIFRDWEKNAILNEVKPAGEANQVGSFNLIADLLVSQAKAAAVLEHDGGLYAAFFQFLSKGFEAPEKERPSKQNSTAARLCTDSVLGEARQRAAVCQKAAPALALEVAERRLHRKKGDAV